MKSIWREPLFHFIVLGALLFAGHALWQRAVTQADYTIDISTAELERQALIFAGENRRQPTDEDLTALLFSHVEEQALMREALRLGLDEDDTIIRRRLAQKMRFLIEDVDPPALPDEAVLRDWFGANTDQFVTPELRSFSHIYLSPETRDEGIEAEAEGLLSLANSGGEDWQSLGDPFIMKRSFSSVSATDITRVFGTDFAAGLFGLEAGTAWQGPVSSAFGVHLIRLDSVEPEVIPSFDDVKDQVGAAWQERTRRAQNTDRLRTLISKYKVNVEDLKMSPSETLQTESKASETPPPETPSSEATP